MITFHGGLMARRFLVTFEECSRILEKTSPGQVCFVKASNPWDWDAEEDLAVRNLIYCSELAIVWAAQDTISPSKLSRPSVSLHPQFLARHPHQYLHKRSLEIMSKSDTPNTPPFVGGIIPQTRHR